MFQTPDRPLWALFNISALMLCCIRIWRFFNATFQYVQQLPIDRSHKKLYLDGSGLSHLTIHAELL